MSKSPLKVSHYTCQVKDHPVERAVEAPTLPPPLPCCGPLKVSCYTCQALIEFDTSGYDGQKKSDAGWFYEVRRGDRLLS